MLIIGCGNRERSDDGAGILVAERLRELGIDAEMRTGEAADLIEAWKGADDVIVVDTVMTGAPVGTVQAWDGRQPLASVSINCFDPWPWRGRSDRTGSRSESPSNAAPGLRNRGTAIRTRSRDLSRSTACCRGSGAKNHRRPERPTRSWPAKSSQGRVVAKTGRSRCHQLRDRRCPRF